MEITLREIIASTIVLAIMLIIGISLSDKINNSLLDKNEMYNKALKIDNQDIFEYGMRTNVGNSFIYGEFETVDPVSLPDEIDGEYMMISKSTERYTQHIELETYIDSDGNVQTRTVIKWSWDLIDSEEFEAKKIRFLNNEFDLSKFKDPHFEYIDTIYSSDTIRSIYYAVPSNLEGTIFTSLMNNNISDNIKIYEDLTIDETLNYLTNSGKVRMFFFWVLWLGFTGGVIYVFYCGENKWLY